MVDDVGQETWDGVLVADCALVPVVRDTLVAVSLFEFSGLASDGRERLELLLGQATFGELPRGVGHHADWEWESSWGDENTGEGGVEEGGVVLDGAVESSDAKVEQVVVLGAGINTFYQSVLVLLELMDLDLVIVATIRASVAT